jgi:hypothetical protein
MRLRSMCSHLLQRVDQRFVGRAIRCFAAGETECERAAAGLTGAVHFTGEPAARAAKSLFASPLLHRRPDALPRTVVESML